MIAPVLIDLSGTIDQFYLSEQETRDLSRYVLDNMSKEYMKNWERLIESNLSSTRGEYMDAIFDERPDDFTAVFGMTPRQSKLGMMLEEGASQFDIKDGFAKSNKRVTKLATNKDGTLKRDKYGKTSYGGWYLTIPFRHATPEAVAESFSSKMPGSIYQLTKTSSKPLKLRDLPGNFNKVRTSHAGYQHKAAIYEGLHRRDISSTNKEKRGGYYTFRRVSSESDDNSWMHPGFQALNLMEKAINNTRFDYVTDKAIDEFLTKRFS